LRVVAGQARWKRRLGEQECEVAHQARHDNRLAVEQVIPAQD